MNACDFPDWTAELARLHDQPLRRYAYSLCHDWELAADAVQSTWLRFYKQNRGDVEPKIPAWLFLVCRRQVVDYLRRNGRMIHEMPDAERVADEGGDAAPAQAAELSDAARAEVPERSQL
jgi:RNA polymerase sigma factor (sigma-70 family)